MSKRKEKKIIAKVTNVEELRDSLMEVHTDLKNGDIDLAEAIVINNNAGKIIKLIRVELDYYAMANRLIKSKFIEG